MVSGCSRASVHRGMFTQVHIGQTSIHLPSSLSKSMPTQRRSHSEIKLSGALMKELHLPWPRIPLLSHLILVGHLRMKSSHTIPQGSLSHIRHELFFSVAISARKSAHVWGLWCVKSWKHLRSWKRWTLSTIWINVLDMIWYSPLPLLYHLGSQSGTWGLREVVQWYHHWQGLKHMWGPMSYLQREVVGTCSKKTTCACKEVWWYCWILVWKGDRGAKCHSLDATMPTLEIHLFLCPFCQKKQDCGNTALPARGILNIYTHIWKVLSGLVK